MKKKGKPRGRSYEPGQSGNPQGRPPGARNIDHGVLTDLMRKYLEESLPYEVGEGKDRHSVVTRRMDIFIRSVLNEAIQGNVPAQRLVFNYVDGLPQLHVRLEGRLVNLGYDLPLSEEDEAQYGELLDQFFPGGAGLEEYAAGKNPGGMTLEELQRREAREKEIARVQVLRDAGVDVFDDAILQFRPPSAGDPPDDAPENPDVSGKS